MFSGNIIDSHCHLDRFDDPGAVITRARASGVTPLISISVSRQNYEVVFPLTQEHADVFCTAGVHPCDVAQEMESPDVVCAWLQEKSGESKVIAFGETGLDYQKTSPPHDKQQEYFMAHVHAALAVDMPLVVHMRDSEQDFCRLMENLPCKPRGVLHCFTGSLPCAMQAISWGWKISISGIVTFPSAKALQNVVSQIPLEHLIVETDAPWLAPQPHRGQKNEPAFIKETARFIAQIQGVSYETLCDVTRKNTYGLFTRIPRVS